MRVMGVPNHLDQSLGRLGSRYLPNSLCEAPIALFAAAIEPLRQMPTTPVGGRS